MESSRSAQFKVGILIGLGILFFIVTVILLGGNKTFFKPTVFYKAYFKQVQGLGSGSVVQMLGIPIGNISKIEFVNVEGSEKLNVIMRIDKAYQEKITKGTRVEIRTQGALGDKYIYLIPGSPLEPVLADGDFRCRQQSRTSRYARR